MPAGMHHSLGRWSFDALGAPERRFWKTMREEMPDLCSMPDRYPLDPERWGPYVELPGGGTLPHGPADSERTGPPFVWKHDRRVATKVLLHYARKITGAIRKRSVRKSAIFAAALAHYIQDCAGPGHVMNHYLMLRLLPGECASVAHIHRDLDDIAPPRPAPFRPVLLGESVAEAVFNAEGRLEQVIEAALAAVVPAVQAIAFRRKNVARKALESSYHSAVRLVTSFWHTCFALAWGRIPKGDHKRLGEVMLSAHRPNDAFTLDPYPWEPRSGGSLVEGAGAAPVPLTQRVRRAGRIRAVKCSDGIAMVHGHVFYRIPPGVYRKLCVRVGFLARPEQSAAGTFKVILGSRPPTYEYGTARVLSAGGRTAAAVTLRHGATAREISVPLGGARGVTLLAIADPLNAQVVWARPRLLK